jgi:hypothetical protein
MRLRPAAALILALIGSLTAVLPTAFAEVKSDDQLLGFSRYLPADTSSYISLLQLDEARKKIASTRAWGRIEAVPEIAQLLQMSKAQMESEQLPPPLKTGIDLLKRAASSEISFATSGDASQNSLNFAKVAMLSVATMAPTQHAPDSEEGRALEAKRAPLRAQWAAAVPNLRLPSIAVAARVSEAAKFEMFVNGMVDLGWQAATGEIRKNVPPPVFAVFENAYKHVKVGEVPMIRFRVKIGDLVGQEDLEQGFAMLPITDGEKKLAIDALRNISIDAHLGFIGEYLTLVIGPNDAFASQIVERFEGRSKDSLAASAGFGRIRTEMTPQSIAVLYAEHTEAQREIRRTFLPLLNTLADPELHSLLGAPPEVTLIIHRVQYQLEKAILGTPLKQESVVNIDQGLKQMLRSEYDRDPATAATTPLRTLSLVPEKSIAYSVTRHASAETLCQEIRYLVEQQRMQIRTMATRFGGIGGELPDYIKKQEALMDGILKPINEKLEPALQGEMGLILGEFTKFGIKTAPEPKMPIEVRDIPIPTVAGIVHTASADQAIEGVNELFQFLMSQFNERELAGPKGPPVKFAKQDLDGIETWVLSSPYLEVTGIELHLAKIGNALVISSSFDLTKQMRDTSTGKSASIASTATHQAVKEMLPATADQLSFLDGRAFSGNLRSTSEAIFAMLEINREALGIRSRDLESIGVAKRFVGLGLTMMECLKSSTASIVGEGRVDLLRQWIHVEDLQP